MEQIQKPWQGTIAEVLQKLETSPRGLSGFEAEKRILRFGANTISRQTPIPYLAIFFDQFVDLLVLLLIFASLLSFILGDAKSGVIIGVIVFINALIGFTQEFKAERILRALKKYLPSEVRVRRQGQERQIPAHYLAPGDVVILGEGEKVPADIRLLEAYDLKINEQTLTGETKSRAKFAKNDGESQTSLLEVENTLFMGTAISEGEGMGIVTSTGMATEFGRIAARTTEIDKTLSPLQEKTHRMAKKVALIAVSVTIALVAFRYFTAHDFLDALIFSVAVAAALVPEGLPATISVALSLGARNLASRKALVRNLVSVETLGSVTVICSDKTGTLTTGQMTVKEVWDDINSDIGKEEKENLLLKVLTLCNDAEINERGAIGDPMEIALLRWVNKNRAEEFRRKYRKIDEIPFNSRRKFMQVTYADGGRRFNLAKGAPEVIMSRCHLSKSEEEKINLKHRQFAWRGFRVLAAAYNEVFLGLVAIYDPPRPEVKAAIKICQQGGIRTLMITGDHSLTAKAIAEQVGILETNSAAQIIEGADLEKMSDIELKNVLRKDSVYARILPEQKYRLVENLMAMGEIVAVTGDGVNDAPALKKADIGIAMGKTGTDVSREAADMILLDDNFATIVEAVEEGRAIFDNIKKFLFYIFSSNFGELLTVVFGMLLGLPLPLTAIQILAVDLGTDVLPSMSLIAEPPEGEIIKTKPRAKEVQLLNGESFFHLAMIGLIMGAGAVWNFSAVKGFTGSYEAATTAALATLVISQGFNVFLSRCPGTSIFRYPFWQNKYLILSVVSSVILILAITYLDFFHQYIRTESFPPFFWTRIVLTGIILLAVEEIYKILRPRY